MAGWRQAADFFRPFATRLRSKFRWLEPVPGAPGYYTVSEKGRDKVIGPSEKLGQRSPSGASEAQTLS